MSTTARPPLPVAVETRRRPGDWLRAFPPSLAVIGLFALVAAFAPLIAPYGPTEIVGAPSQAPSATHPFGTDPNGMDVLSRVVYGARKDLLLALVASAAAAGAGLGLGSVAGYLGGWADAALKRVTEVVQAFPVILLAMAVLVAIGPSLVNIAAVIAVINVPVYFRIVRSIVLPMREADFVQAARCTGNSSAEIIGRHLLPNLWRPIVAQFSVNFAWAIQVIAGLSFLGIGVRLPEAEWGLMIQQGADGIITGEWWTSFFPGLAIFVVVWALNRVGAWVERRARA